MSLFYEVNPSYTSPNRVQNPSSLGIFTKSHVIRSPQGIQRLHDFLLQDQSAKLLPKERVCNCLKNRIDKYKPRDIKYSESRKKAHWSNVQRCGSIWSCPVCAKQITEKRRQELKTGLNTWKTHFKGSVYLLTLTFSHSPDQSLRNNLSGLKRAMKRFYETTRVQAIFKELGVHHKIKGLEVTYGKNGWHPHHHVLLLADYHNLGFKDYQNELTGLWIKACINSGLNAPSMKHGLDLRNGYYAEQYVSKWGIEDEITKGHTKKGREGGYTPFDLLQLSIENQEIYGKLPSKLFQEFAIAMKGARQLVWSRGLKKLLDIEEKTDEELAEETEKNAITLTIVEDFIFSLLCHYQKRHEYLRAIESDYENGIFGNGSAENLLITLLEKSLSESAVTETLS